MLFIQTRPGQNGTPFRVYKFRTMTGERDTNGQLLPDPVRLTRFGSWKEKFDLDVWYVDNRSLWLDIRILFLTIWKVFKQDGISQEGEATAAPFTGSGRAAGERD